MSPAGHVTEAQERMVGYILDNLTLDNMARKVHDLSKVLRLTDNEEHCEWLSFHLVGRVAFQPSKHELFNTLLRVVKSKELEEKVVRETYRNISILLSRTERRMESQVMLINLGQWLGLIRLARNKPILMVDLDIKLLILEALQAGVEQISHLVPFVIKVLESAASSKVFKPPCPWTTGILNLLTQMTLEPRLGSGLKLDILKLCTTLGFQTSQQLLPDNPRLLNLTEPYLCQGRQECDDPSFEIDFGPRMLSDQIELLGSQSNQVNSSNHLFILNTGNTKKSLQGNEGDQEDRNGQSPEGQIYQMQKHQSYQSYLDQDYPEQNFDNIGNQRSEDQDSHQTYYYESYLEYMDQQNYQESPIYQIDPGQNLVPYSAITYQTSAAEPMQDYQNYQNFCGISSVDCPSVDFCSWLAP